MDLNTFNSGSSKVLLTVCVSGLITLRHWASATERVLSLGLPWRVLRPLLVNSTQSGMVDYKKWIRELSITEPKLEVSIAQLVSLFSSQACIDLNTALIFYFRCQTTTSWRPCTEITPTWKPSSESLTQITQVSKLLCLDPNYTAP